MDVCDTKILYDTEFEAQVALAKTEYRHNKEMEIYQCGNHFHLSSKHREERRGVGYRYFKHALCEQIVLAKNKFKHLEKCKGRPMEERQTRHYFIQEPVWNGKSGKGREVGLSAADLRDDNRVDIMYKKADGERLYPDTFFITKEEAVEYPVSFRRGVKLYMIPVVDMKILEAA